MSSEPVQQRVTVVIPTLDEARALPGLLSDLARQRGVELDVVVVDGGSSDETTSLALEHGATVLSAQRGRGRQMNAGRQVAQHEDLLFLHADTRIPDGGTVRAACAALAEERTRRSTDRVAGHFTLRFRDVPPEQRARFRFLEEKSALNRRHTTNGDQGLLIPAGFFDELGGFDDELWFLEDQKLAERIHESGVWITLPGTVETSARRFFAEGFGPRYLAMAAIMSAWSADVDEFFEVAPQLYKPQGEAEALGYLDVIGAIDDTMARLETPRREEVWRAVGDYALENAWQAAFAVDVALSSDDVGRECLQLYERLVEPFVVRRVPGAMIGRLLERSVMGALPAMLRLCDLVGLSSAPASR